MIQRIQTVYLLLAVLCAAATFVFPYAHFYSGEAKISEYVMFGLINVQSETMEMAGPYLFPIWVLGALAVLAPAIAMFLYKKRPLQYKIARLSYIVNLAYVVYLFFAIDAINTDFYESGMRVLHHIGFYLPIAAFVFCFLAVRGIKKDEDLVKSLDRIR